MLLQCVAEISRWQASYVPNYGSMANHGIKFRYLHSPFENNFIKLFNFSKYLVFMSSYTFTSCYVLSNDNFCKVWTNVSYIHTL